MNNKTLGILILIFIINPFLGVLAIVSFKMMINQREDKSDLLLFIFITLFSCLLQSARIWNIYLPSDWNESYAISFQEVNNTSAFSYIFSQKEPVWNLLNYIGYYVNNGSAFIFLNEIAIFTIFLTLLSIFIYWKETKSNPSVLIASLALVAFFSEYYSQLNNLLRQYFSLSIVVYAYVKRSAFEKPSWKLLIIASLIHSLSAIFLLLYTIKPLYKNINFISLIKITGITIGISSILINLESIKVFFAQIELLTYGFDRLLGAGNPADQNFLEPSTVYLNAFLLISTLAIFMPYTPNTNGLVFYRNILIAIMLLSSSLAIIAPEIMGRLYISRFLIFPFILPYLLVNSKAFSNIYCYSIVIFFFIRFILKFDSIRDGGFFPPINELLTYSIFNYLI